MGSVCSTGKKHRESDVQPRPHKHHAAAQQAQQSAVRQLKDGSTQYDSTMVVPKGANVGVGTSTTASASHSANNSPQLALLTRRVSKPLPPTPSQRMQQQQSQPQQLQQPQHADMNLLPQQQQQQLQPQLSQQQLQPQLSQQQLLQQQPLQQQPQVQVQVQQPVLASSGSGAPSAASASASAFPTNSALAPVLGSAELQRGLQHLEHVSSEQVRPSIYGGQHDRRVPAAAAAESLQGEAPMNALLAPLVRERALQDTAGALAHVPLRAENFTEFGGISMHPKPVEQQQVPSQGQQGQVHMQQSQGLPQGQLSQGLQGQGLQGQGLQGQAQAQVSGAVPASVASLPPQVTSVLQVVQEVTARPVVLGQLEQHEVAYPARHATAEQFKLQQPAHIAHTTQPAQPQPQQTFQPQQVQQAQTTSQAQPSYQAQPTQQVQQVQPTQQYQQVQPQQPAPTSNPQWSEPASAAALAPAALLAQSAREVGEAGAATNAALARRVGPSELAAASATLEPVVALPSVFGGQHAPNALDVPVVPVPAELQSQAAALHHVSAQQAQPTLSGGVHAHAQDTRIVPEAAAARGNNASLAGVIQPEQLAAHKAELAQVTGVAPGNFGSVHDANALLPVQAGALVAQSHALHHVPIGSAPTTASGGVHLIAKPDTHVIPEGTFSDSSLANNNATLAGRIAPSELASQKKALEAVTGVQPSVYGGIHDQTALLPAAGVDRVALQYVAGTLNHVPIASAPTTASGGVHLIAKELQHLRPLPDALESEELVAVNATLAENIQPAQLASQKKALEAVTGVQPSMYGGVHDRSADLGGVVDRVALQYVARHELAHVPLDKAAPTPAGGVHLIAQPDTQLIPEQASDAAGSANNATLAAAILPADLRHEKRALAHVPLENQRQTMSGGLNAANEPVHLSLLDRVKGVLGFETHATQAPELGRVVTPPTHGVPSAHIAAQHALRHVVPEQQQAAAVSMPLPAAPAAAPAAAPTDVLPFPQNARLAEQITSADLQHASPRLVAPVASNTTLAPLVTAAALGGERARLHHVNLERLEMRRDLAAGVGQVTTRRATPRRRNSASASILQQQAAFEGEQLAVPADATLTSMPASISPRSHALPTVVGRSSAGASHSASNSPRQTHSPRLAQLRAQPLAPLPVPASDALVGDKLAVDPLDAGYTLLPSKEPDAAAPAAASLGVGKLLPTDDLAKERLTSLAMPLMPMEQHTAIRPEPVQQTMQY